MRTVFQKFQKLYSSRLLCFLCVTFVSAVTLKAETEGLYESDFDEELSVSVQDISYDYKLFTDASSRLDCQGTLKFHVTPPVDTEHLLFERTTHHISDLEDVRYFFGVKAVLTPEPGYKTREGYPWGIFFRVRALLPEGRSVCSPIYSINDYIDKDDLDKILNQSKSIDAITDQDITLYVQNKNLYVKTNESLSLVVYDMYGQCVYNGDIKESLSISLGCVTTPFVIVTTKTQSKTSTQKLFVQ